jgi:hypothetical protein
MCHKTSGHQANLPEDLLSPPWEVGEIIQQYLKLNKDLGTEKVESTLKQIRENLFERMRKHPNHSLTWDQVVQALRNHQISLESTQKSFENKKTTDSNQTDNSPGHMNKVSTANDDALRHVFKGDWKTVCYSIKFVESLRTGEWSPILNRDPPPTEIEHCGMLIDKKPPLPIRIGLSGKCIHYACPNIQSDELESLHRFQLNLSPYRSFTLARTTKPM